MKRILSVLMVALMAVSLASCDWFKKNDTKKEVVVENLVSEDTKYMVENYDTAFVYYETEIILKDYLDGECDGSFESVTNVFQAMTLVDSTLQPTVVKFIHIGEMSKIEKENGYWLEDMPLRDGDVMVSYKDAYQKINEVNYPKPHARACTLRKEVGPCPANAQYIFGDVHAQLYVDAVTGNVSENSPAFECNRNETENDTVQ